jgi:amidohydrolase
MKQLQILAWFVFIPNLLYSQKLPEGLDRAITDISSKVAEVRRQLHVHPELSNQEYNTSAFVSEYLKKLGLEVHTGIANTGIVAILKGQKSGPVIALRADMDGLPVFERNNLPYASRDSGDYLGEKVPVMHACGHDAHVAILLGTAEVLTRFSKQISGTIKFIFQPAEEGIPGKDQAGAFQMVKEGVMDNPKVDVIFALHINSQTETGKIKYKPGAVFAANDWFTIQIHGKQTHGAQPWSGIDPIVIAAQIIEGFQTIVSRQEPLTRAPVVITIGKIEGGLRNNIIPEEVTLEGTIRTLDTAMQKDVHQRVIRMATKIAEASGATASVIIEPKGEITYNDPSLVSLMLPSLEKAAGKENVEVMDWRTGSEDFSYFGDKAPSFYFFIGGMPPGQTSEKAAPHHSPDFLIDDSRLDIGIRAFCHIVFDYERFKSVSDISGKLHRQR